MPSRSIAAAGGFHRFGLTVAAVLLAAAALSPIALASVARPVGAAGAAALAHAFQEAGLVCQVADWAAPPANPRCLVAADGHGAWLRSFDFGQP
jgi:hypothetical protein